MIRKENGQTVVVLTFCCLAASLIYLFTSNVTNITLSKLGLASDWAQDRAANVSLNSDNIQDGFSLSGKTPRCGCASRERSFYIITFVRRYFQTLLSVLHVHAGTHVWTYTCTTGPFISSCDNYSSPQHTNRTHLPTTLNTMNVACSLPGTLWRKLIRKEKKDFLFMTANLNKQDDSIITTQMNVISSRWWYTPLLWKQCLVAVTSKLISQTCEKSQLRVSLC